MALASCGDEGDNKGFFETNDKGYITAVYFNDDDESYDNSFKYDNAKINRNRQYTHGFERALLCGEAPSKLLFVGLLGNGPAYYHSRVNLRGDTYSSFDASYIYMY